MQTCFEQNGKQHGRHYDKWVNWDEDTIIKYTVPMESLPNAVLKSIKRQISIFEEVNERSGKRIELNAKFIAARGGNYELTRLQRAAVHHKPIMEGTKWRQLK